MRNHNISLLKQELERFLSFKTLVLPKANVDECRLTSPGTKNQTGRVSAKRKILQHKKGLEVITEKSSKAFSQVSSCSKESKQAVR